MKGLQIDVGRYQQIQKKSWVYWITVTSLIMAGFSKLFLSAFSEVESYWLIYAAAGSLSCLLCIWLYTGKSAPYVMLTGCSGLLVLFLINFSASLDGIMSLVNTFLTWLTGKTGRIYLDYPAEGGKNVYWVTALLILLLALMLAGTIYYGKASFIYLLSLIGLCGCATGFLQIDFACFFVLAGILYFLFYRNFILLKMQCIWKTWFVSLAVLALCIGFAFLAGRLMVLNTTNLVVDLERTVHQLIYDKANHAMPEGNLVNLGKVERNQEPSLMITAEKPQKFYLRGLTGDIYTGTSWEAFDEQIYRENEALFYWLHKNGFFGQSMIEQTASLSGKTEIFELKIDNLSACKKYQYLPYGLAGSKNLDAHVIGDGTVIAQNESYVMEYTDGSIPEWYRTAVYLAQNQENAEVAEYLKQEQSYCEFVYKNNLQISNQAIGVCNRILGTDEDQKTLSEILELIRTTLSEKLEYDENIETLNGNNDFFQYTMEQSKSGYSVHYATAATLMLRYYGVPARYVEGYFLSADEAAEYESGESIILTEAHAHAWTEYYMDGIGWIPFEVTPGYIDEEEYETVAQTVADSFSEAIDGGKSFNQNPLIYSPPPEPKEDTQVPDLNSMFRFQVKYLISVFGLLLLVLLGLAILWIRKRRQKLLRFRLETEQMDNRSAIAECYAYADMLMNRCGGETSFDMEVIRALNREAMFSGHEMSDSQKEQMRLFVQEVVGSCRKRNGLWKTIRYHYILWLY